jgi:hypothetical protein
MGSNPPLSANETLNSQRVQRISFVSGGRKVADLLTFASMVSAIPLADSEAPLNTWV